MDVQTYSSMVGPMRTLQRTSCVTGSNGSTLHLEEARPSPRCKSWAHRTKGDGGLWAISIWLLNPQCLRFSMRDQAADTVSERPAMTSSCETDVLQRSSARFWPSATFAKQDSR